jgi:hypothetical protein
VTAFLPANTVSSSGQIQLDAITGTTFATTDFTFPQAVTASNVLITGIATVRELQTLLVTSSIIFESGSTKFGDTADDTHQFTGSLSVLGNVSSSIGFSGSGANITNIPNSGLVNSSVTVNGTAISLGGSGTVTAAAGTLTGTTLASGVTASSLTSVGTLSSLSVTGDLTVDTSTFKVDSVNNRVGIGTSTPGAPLHVAFGSAVNDAEFRLQQTTNFTAAQMSLIANNDGGAVYNFIRSQTNAGTEHWRIGAGATAGNFVVSTNNNVERMRIDASGNVGIGVTPSAWFSNYKAFQVNTNGSLTSNTDFFALSNNAFVNSSGDDIYLVTGFAGRYRHVASNGAHQWFTAASGTAGNAITFTERMTIDASGNVGIGTASPQDKLDVNGSIRFRANTPNFTAVADNAVLDYVPTSIFATDPCIRLVAIGTSSVPAQIRLLTGTSASLVEAMRITGTGNVGIGTTSPGGKLDVVGAVNISGLLTVNIPDISTGENVGLKIVNSGGGGSTWHVTAGLTGVNNAEFVIRNGVTDVNAVVIGTSGNVTIAGSLSKGSGSFKIDHPLANKSDTHQLVHSFIEGPQADLIYRGKIQLVDGRAEINIDYVSGMTEGTFVVLNRDVQCFTSNESAWDAVKGFVVGNILTIECQNPTSTALVSWLVIGERHDKHMYETDWTNENGKVIVEPLKNS